MKINKEILKGLKPCTNRWENYLKHYADFEGSLEEFFVLDKISNADKVFVLKKMIPVRVLVFWAKSCAKSVEHLKTPAADAASYAADAASYAAAADAAAASYAAADAASSYAAAEAADAAQWTLNYKLLIKAME